MSNEELLLDKKSLKDKGILGIRVFSQYTIIQLFPRVEIHDKSPIPNESEQHALDKNSDTSLIPRARDMSSTIIEG